MKYSEDIEERLKKVNKLYKKVIEHYRLEDIHQFRVAVKKLRAFLRLAEFSVSEDEKLKVPSDVKSLYGYSGSVRNLQLQQQRISEICFQEDEIMPISYLQVLQKEIDDWMKEAEDLPVKPSDRKQEKVLKLIPEKLKEDAPKEFLLSKWNMLFVLIIKKDLQDDELHEVRKILKDLIYNWKQIEAYVFMLPAYLADQQSIESLTDTLGDFHDLSVALHFLQPIYVVMVDQKEEDALQRITAQLKKEKQELKENLMYRFAQMQITRVEEREFRTA